MKVDIQKNGALPFSHPSSLIPPDGGILSVALSLSSAQGSGRGDPPTKTVGVTHHCGLWSPDFPLLDSRRAATIRPARGKIHCTNPRSVCWNSRISVGQKFLSARVYTDTQECLRTQFLVVSLVESDHPPAKFGVNMATTVLNWHENPPNSVVVA